MKTVNQIAKQTGVSVRTLHHYDAIGLLKPTQVTEAGYRLYDDAALERLYLILLFREIEGNARWKIRRAFCRTNPTSVLPFSPKMRIAPPPGGVL